MGFVCFISFTFVGVKSVDKAGKEIHWDLEEKINMSVFPGLQGGPHNNNIAGITVAMKMVGTKEFREYQRQVVANARTLCDGLISRGYKVSSGGTDNHMLLLDLSTKRLSGAKGERILEEIAISCNKNTGNHTVDFSHILDRIILVSILTA